MPSTISCQMGWTTVWNIIFGDVSFFGKCRYIDLYIYNVIQGQSETFMIQIRLM